MSIDNDVNEPKTNTRRNWLIGCASAAFNNGLYCRFFAGWGLCGDQNAISKQE